MHCPPLAFARLAPAIGLLGSLACATLLHRVGARAEAAWVVAVALPWGFLVSVCAGRAPALPWLLALAAGARLVHVGAAPTLSDDVYRYLFEGTALNAGYNPFASPPSQLAYLAPALAEQVNHPDMTSIYPPVALLWFRLLAAAGATASGAQLATAAVDVANVALLHACLRARARPTWPALVYALHPVPVLESAHGAHLEPLAIAACLAAVLWAEHAPRRALAAMWVGVGTKLLPILFLPALTRRLGLWTSAAGSAGALALLVLAAAPVLDAGAGLGASFGRYAADWSFNGLLHPILSALVGDLARPALGGLAGLVTLAALRERDPARAWLWVGSGFVCLSPTVHPWYLLWALPPSLLLGGRGWALASTSLMGSYLVLATLDPATGAWAVPWWLGPATWGGALAGVLYARRLDAPTAA